jgi:hypothetical protein
MWRTICPFCVPYSRVKLLYQALPLSLHQQSQPRFSSSLALQLYTVSLIEIPHLFSYHQLFLLRGGKHTRFSINLGKPIADFQDNFLCTNCCWNSLVGCYRRNPFLVARPQHKHSGNEIDCGWRCIHEHFSACCGNQRCYYLPRYSVAATSAPLAGAARRATSCNTKATLPRYVRFF